MEKKTIITHSGSYHADDMFAVATLLLFLEREGKSAAASGETAFEVIRTRDDAVIEKGDYVVDVGGVYDEARKRFDHHQAGGAGKRENGIPYASFGLVWKYCGEKLCGSKEVAEAIERRLVQPIDANDSGFDIVENKFEDIHPYLVQNFLYAFQPTWKESGASIDDIFLKLLDIAKQILEREIKRAQDGVEAKDFVEKAYQDASDKRLIVLDGAWPWKDVIMEHPEPLFVVFPEISGHWGVRAVPKETHSFQNRKDLPAEWAGKRKEEFVKVSGVSDAIFCHLNLFVAYAASKEGAIALAKLALK